MPGQLGQHESDRSRGQEGVSCKCLGRPLVCDSGVQALAAPVGLSAEGRGPALHELLNERARTGAAAVVSSGREEAGEGEGEGVEGRQGEEAVRGRCL